MPPTRLDARLTDDNRLAGHLRFAGFERCGRLVICARVVRLADGKFRTRFVPVGEIEFGG
jgi:hypothetical protein